MIKLTKIFQGKPDAYGFINEIEIKCDYDPEDEIIDNVRVIAYDMRRQLTHELTEFFESEPFASIVDNIDWPEVYSTQQGRLRNLNDAQSEETEPNVILADYES